MIGDGSDMIEGAPELDDEPAYAAWVAHLDAELNRTADRIEREWRRRPLTKREVARRH